jgi:hypothetical protein
VWDEKNHHWQNKLFIKDSISQFLHLPLPGTYKRCINRLQKLATDADATPDKNDFLFLSHDPSPWKSDLYMLVKKEVPGAENVRLSGSFISKVFDGSFSKIPQYIRDMDIFLAGQNQLAGKYYFYFATCPECAKKYGHNYIVAFAEV